MKKLFAVVVLMMLVWHHAFSLDLNITLNNAGDLINQVDLSKLDEVESLTIAGDLNGTDILVIRKMVNMLILDMSDANIVYGGNSYYEDYTTSKDKVGDYFFSDNNKIEKIILPNSVTDIENYAFSGCSLLSDVTIGKSIQTIRDKAFKGCSGLSSLTFLCPTVYAWFSGMTFIKKVVFGEGVKTIGYRAFEGCTGLMDVIIGNGVTDIGVFAFGSCVSLTSVEIPNSVITISESAFAHCI